MNLRAYNLSEESSKLQDYTATTIFYKYYEEEFINKILSWINTLGPYKKIKSRVKRGQRELIVEVYDKNLGEWFNISDCGSGIANALPILITLATADEDCSIFIEEPETGLHPAAQLELAEIIADVARKNQIIITTHSELILMKFLRYVLQGKIKEKDLAIYVVYKDEEGTKVHRVAPKIPLEELPENVEKALEAVGARGIFEESLIEVEKLAEE